MGDSERSCSPECRLPQGSPLSPTLFLIYINDLLEEMKRVGVDVQAYTDDILAWMRGDFWASIASVELRKALRVVDDWAKRWRLTFNPNKCNAIYFSCPWVRIAQEFQVGLQASPIPKVRDIQYLGVWFDANLL